MSIRLSGTLNWLRPTRLLSLDSGLLLKAGDALSGCRGTRLRALGKIATGSLQEDLLVRPCQGLSPGSSKMLPGSKARVRAGREDQGPIHQIFPEPQGGTKHWTHGTK